MITLYILIGFGLELIIHNLGRWSSPNYKPLENFERMVIIILWPLTIIIFLYHFIIELLKHRK